MRTSGHVLFLSTALLVGYTENAQADAGALIEAAADKINGVIPQAVVQQTIELGSFYGSSREFEFKLESWVEVPLPEPIDGPRDAVPPEQQRFIRAYVAPINSYNLRYDIVVSNKPDGLEIVLGGAGIDGNRVEYQAQFNSKGTLASIEFHPSGNGFQQLSFSWPGGQLQVWLKTKLADQLGAFVVPHLLISIIYEPPGGHSLASYGKEAKSGTVVSWGIAKTSGLTTRQDPQATLGAVRALVDLIPTAGGAMSALLDLPEQTSWLVTEEETQTMSEERGIFLTSGEGFRTSNDDSNHFPGTGDLFIVLRDVLVVYVLLDGKVTLSPVAYSRSSALTLEEAFATLPREQVLRFQGINPLTSRKVLTLISQSNEERGTRGWATEALSSSRFKYVRTGECKATSIWRLSLEQEEIVTQRQQQTQSQSRVTKVTGLMASITGSANQDTFTAVEYSTTTADVVSDISQISLEVQCAADEDPFEVDVYFDEVFRTFLAVKGPALAEQAVVSGIVEDQNGNPMPGQPVELDAGGKTFQVIADEDGRFAFHSRSIPEGSGPLRSAGSLRALELSGAPMADVTLKAKQEFPGEIRPKQIAHAAVEIGPGVTLENISITRLGSRTVRLKFDVSNTRDRDVNLNEFGMTSYPRGLNMISLQDFDAGKRYAVIHDEKGDCVCSSSNLTIAAGGRRTYWAQFAAPPLSVASLTFSIPGGIPIDNIPVQ